MKPALEPEVVWKPQLDDSGSDAQPNPLMMFAALGANELKLQRKHSGRASTQVCVFRAAPCWLAAPIMHRRLGPAVGSSRIQQGRKRSLSLNELSAAPSLTNQLR